MAPSQPRYKIASTLPQLCGLLGISLDNVIRRTGMSGDMTTPDARGVTTEEYFEGWYAIEAEANRDDLPLALGKAYARGPFNPAFFAFTSSPTVRIGLERLAVFKPIVGPLIMAIRPTDLGLQIVKSANPPTVSLPLSFSATEFVFFVEAIRNSSGAHIVPTSATLPARMTCHAELEDFLGCPIKIGEPAELTLSQEDAARPLLSVNPDQWATMEPAFKRQLATVTDHMTTTARLRNAITEMLPSGLCDIDEAARRMRLSTRSLQRYLSAETTRFQHVLDGTRRDLALHYLRNSELNIEEISYLLAYRDPNSFYRAFHIWTGMTPKEARLGSPRKT